MTPVVDNREFRCGAPYRIPDLTDIELRRCTFVVCQHPGWHQPNERPVLRRVNLVRCHARASELGPVIAEDSTIDTIWFHRDIWGPQLIAGCAPCLARLLSGLLDELHRRRGKVDRWNGRQGRLPDSGEVRASPAFLAVGALTGYAPNFVHAPRRPPRRTRR